MEAVSSPLQHFKFSGVRQQRFQNCSSSSRRGENTFFLNMVPVSYNADKKLRKVNKTSYNSFLSSYASTNMTGTVVKPTLEVSNMKRHCAQNAYGSTEACVLSDNIPNVSLNTAQEKVGVLLLNLGGPETLDDVQPFLFNLFADPDIIRLPRLLRFLQKPLANLISTFRAPKSKKAYASIGGGSPLKKITEEQAIALKTVLEGKDVHANVCVAMRYWHPFTEEAIHKIKRDGITKLVILPLYPQFSISTSGSSICVLKKVFREDDYFKKVPISIIESWYRRKGYITSMADLIEKELSKFSKPEEVVIFFSAHGVPLSYVESAGDPYRDQMEDCVGLIIHELKSRGLMNNHILAYQSRVGPIQWLKPYTDEVIVELGKKGVRSLLTVPISFVSEHIETLEEIDMEYRQLAAESGIKNWGRVPTLGLTPSFISDLADAVIEAIPSAACIATAEMSPVGVAVSGGGGRLRRITKLFFGLILAIIVSLFFAPRMLRAVRYKFN